jgi:hypothetical protein
MTPNPLCIRLRELTALSSVFDPLSNDEGGECMNAAVGLFG